MTAHSQRAHALLSASGAHRWMNCTPSAVLEDEFPDTTSQAAKEGTLAHEIAEVKARHYIGEFGKAKRTRELNKLKKNELYEPEMEGYTEEYLVTIKKAALAFKRIPKVFIEKKVSLERYIPGGFGTVDCAMASGNTLHVIDFKYGKGVPVNAQENKQLMLYALGVADELSMLYKFDTVILTIVQPRIDNTNSWELSYDDLLDFAEKASEKAVIAAKGEGDYTPGDWCKFCRARQQCRARADENVKLAFETGKKPPLITNEEVGEYLRQGSEVAKWLADLKDFALSECLEGREIAGWKAVEGRASRDWLDMDVAFETIIEDGTNEAMLYERKPLTLAQVEKLMGKAHFADVVGEYVVKKPGKPALVPESDKREAITNKISAKDAFKGES